MFIVLYKFRKQHKNTFLITLSSDIILCFLLQAGSDRHAIPTVKLNIIRLLVDLNVCVNKPEVIDSMLPLFIESLVEGDASTPGLLRLRV